MIHKNPKFDLRLKYRKALEVSVIIALALIIVAFMFFPHVETPVMASLVPQEVITTEPIDPTAQPLRPPPPPRPPIPIESPIDEPLPNAPIFPGSELIPDKSAPPPVTWKGGDDEKVFRIVEENPVPIGGIAAIRAEVKYPELAKRLGIEGTVTVVAFVNEEGIVVKAKVFKGIGVGCDEAAVDAVKRVRFEPGRQRGKPVKARVSIPIVFRLKH